MINTRFNPSLNGNLHLGHITALLVNEHVAHSTGGKCTVRFDDTSHHSTRTGDRMQKIIEGQMEDISWLNIRVDQWIYQSDMLSEVRKILKDANFECLEEDETKEYSLPVSIRLGHKFIFYPFCPRQTAERVVMDRMQGITHLIRGDDFLTEYSYYAYVCQKLGYPMPEYYCISRLIGKNGEDISKTNGGYTVSEYRQNGYSPTEVKRILAMSCLIRPVDGWSLINLKQNPVLMS